jgi:predicted acyl esterase
VNPANAAVMYVGSVNGGIWKTTNGTAAAPAWLPQTDFQNSLSISSIHFDPTDATGNTLIAGIGDFSSLNNIGGPRIGFLQESLRWWDKWLKGVETGIMDEPPVRYLMMASARKGAYSSKNRFIDAANWPPAGLKANARTTSSVGNLGRGFQPWTSQTWTTPNEPAAIHIPSRLKATQQVPATGRVLTSSPVRASQTCRSPPGHAVARSLLSG